MENEKRLIPLQKRIIYAGDVFNSLMAEKRWSATEAAEFVKDFRTVDAVEVVRCKDCKHYDNSEGICWCKLNSKFFPGGFDWHGFPEDGFCSYGERRTDERTD